MANRSAEALALRDGDRERLLSLTRSSSVRAGLAQRARIVLLAADGLSNTAIAAQVGVSRPTVIGWRGRYEQRGMKGLADEPRPGRPRQVDHRAVVAATLTPPPKKLGVTHWSSRLLATRLGIGNATVARAWRDYGIQPWRAETFKFSTDPELVAKVTDVSDCTWPRQRTRSCCAWTRSPRSRPWTAPSRHYRCSRSYLSGEPMTTSATAPPRCSPRWR